MTESSVTESCDLLVVGAGIVGLAHAQAAATRGLRVIVVERDHRCVGASIRNFGFITVTGQPAGDTWRRARISRDVWAGKSFYTCPTASPEAAFGKFRGKKHSPW